MGKAKLHFKNIYLISKKVESITILEGVAGKRIVSLANLRPQKIIFYY
jgi:hypothetical protein